MNFQKNILKKIIIPKKYSGKRIDITLSYMFPNYSRSQLNYFLKKGEITINNCNSKPSYKVLGGEIVYIKLNNINKDINDIHPENIALNIIYEDNEILIINKPNNLVVHPGAGNKKHTLLNALLYYNKNFQLLPRFGLLNRLDKNTTGLIIIAKKIKSYFHLLNQMKNHNIKKYYLALVHGTLLSNGIINTFYGRNPKNRLKMSVLNNGKIATTLFSVQKKYRYLTLVKIKLITGRTHQIRVHMSYINHPIIGDQLYGKKICFSKKINQKLMNVLKNFKRQALHAYKLSFIHPSTQKILKFISPLPEDFKFILSELNKDIILK
ncbi:RluA family pseudouridine synthase [Candidatus Legionella polyplacis]|uniref:Pseudouridine synthase n=1 Tax=Candidatus Legionella polyplacis TaxID=2005262 RepID=A0ABZ2H1G9_9GAMM